MIKYGRQDITKDDIDKIISVCKSEFLTQGSQVIKFEESISNYCSSKFSVAFNSATSALHASCLALGLKKNDYLWTSPISFVASANCGLYCDAKIDFVDINLQTYNICLKDLEKKLQEAKTHNKLPKILVVVHLAGQSCDMLEIHKLSKTYNFKVIEDASHGIGGKYMGKPVGNLQFSDITVFSFHPVKIITTAEGGIATTNNEKINFRLRSIRSHGVTRDKNKMSTYDGPWYYEQRELGWNYRMNEIQAALGNSQLNRLDNYVNVRHEIANTYNYHLKNLPIYLPYQSKNVYSSYHLYIILLKKMYNKYDHRKVFESLLSDGIGVNLHYIPIYKHPFYKKFGFNSKDYKNSEYYYKHAITLPIYPKLKNSEQLKIIKCLKKALKSFARN